MKHTINALAIALFQSGAFTDFALALTFAETFVAANPELFGPPANTAQRGGASPAQRSDVPICTNCGQPVTDHMPGCQLKPR